MVGGAGAAVHVPFPVDPVDPLEPEENSGKKCSFYVRGVANMEILTLMLRESRFFCLLLMQRHAQYIDSCNASAVKRSKKKRAFYVRGVVICEKTPPMLRKNHFFYASHGAWEAYF